MAKYKAINEQDRCVACGVCVKALSMPLAYTRDATHK